MTTAGEFINQAMRASGVLGVGQTLNAQQTQDAVRSFDRMITQWSRRRWLIWNLVDWVLPMTGAQFYTIGAGGDIAADRPNRIEAAFLRQTNPSTPTPVDFPLEIIESQEQYSRLALKSLQSSPSDSLFYDSGFPLGRIYPWPIPSDQYEMHVIIKGIIQRILNTSAELIVPPEYEDAFDWNLRMRFRSAARLPLDPYVAGQARAALQTIRTANLQLDILRMPASVRPRRRYDIYSDRGG